jgi:hypothetical protein
MVKENLRLHVGLLVIDEQMKKCLVVHTAGAKNILLVS